MERKISLTKLGFWTLLGATFLLYRTCTPFNEMVNSAYYSAFYKKSEIVNPNLGKKTNPKDLEAKTEQQAENKKNENIGKEGSKAGEEPKPKESNLEKPKESAQAETTTNVYKENLTRLKLKISYNGKIPVFIPITDTNKIYILGSKGETLSFNQNISYKEIDTVIGFSNNLDTILDLNKEKHTIDLK